MANNNFIVQNGISIGGASGAAISTDAATGAIIIAPAPTSANANPVAVVISTAGTVSTVNTTGGVPATSDIGTSANTASSTGTTAFANISLTGNISTTSTGYFLIPKGNIAQRPGSPTLGMIRYNSEISSFEGYGAGSAWSSLGGVKSVDGKAYIQAETSAGAGDDVLRFYSGSTGTSAQVMWASGANISILPTTAATSTTTGALQVAGGASVQGAFYAGGTIYGTLGTASQPNITTLAGVTSFGTTGVNTTAQGNLIVNGNLQVYGQSVSIGSSTLSINDPIINLNTPQDLSPLTQATTNDIGLKFHYYDTADSAGFLGRAYDTGYLEFYAKGTDTANVFTGTVYGTIKSGGHILTNSTASTSTTTGALTVAGGAGIAGAVYAGSAYDNGSRVITSVTANAGTDISITSATTGGPSASFTINDTSTLNSVLGRGASTTTTMTTGKITPSANVTYDLGSNSNGWWNNIYGTATHALYADLAENYLGDAAYTPGQVLEFGGSAEVTLGTADTTRVAGVVSTNPAHLMNGALTGNNVVPLALTGRVPCNVIGPVKKGDLMVSAGFGFAKTNNNPAVGTVVGKALADFGGAKGQIEVVVGRF